MRARILYLHRGLSRSGATEVSSADREAIRERFFSHTVAEAGRFSAFYRHLVCGR
ncbi:MAG: hypothetical protein K9L70_10585 [Thiohalocapsa sp.]|nr:hypothetical protein [Thiohalocapsa sp.]MCF7989137.1 hypothetical protein [Thiohalocapsa sp.]